MRIDSVPCYTKIKMEAKKMRGKALLVFALFLLVTYSFSQTVTVNDTQAQAGSNYTTISGAYAAVTANAATPDIINITGGGPYIEPAGLPIQTSVTIQGLDCQPVIVTGKTTGLASSVTDVGVAIFVPTGGSNIDVAMKNMTIIPQMGNAPLRGIRSNTNATGLDPTATIGLILDNILVTGNNGSNAPLSTDGMSYVAIGSGTTFRDDQVYLSGNLSYCTISRFISTNQHSGLNTPDGFIWYPDNGQELVMYGPCVFSYMDRLGIQIASDSTVVKMFGTATTPIWILGNGYLSTGNGALAIWADDNSDATRTHEFDYVYVVNNNQEGVLGFYSDDADSLPGCVFNHCIFAGNKRNGLLPADEMKRTWSFNNCTFYGNGTSASETSGIGPINLTTSNIGTGTGNVVITDSVIAGSGITGSSTTQNNLINFTTPSVNLTITNCALVTTGSYFLNTASDAGITRSTTAGTLTLTNNIYADPAFQSVSLNDLALSIQPAAVSQQPNSSVVLTAVGGKYLNVTNTAYATAASGSTALKGAAGYAPNGAFLTWGTSSSAIAAVGAASADTATINLGTTLGTAVITAQSVNGYSAAANVTVTPTDAPLIKE
jgi:hypothetical protein